jgi:hypothetical protein
MQEEEFKQLLELATVQAKQFALRYITNDLPKENIYNIHLNISEDNPALTQYDIYPEDNNRVIEKALLPTVIKTLYRKGKVPVWIDISVSEVQDNKTVLTLLCAGRYSPDLQELYYHNSGLGPFGVKSPILPPDYKEGSKFRIPETKKSILARLFRRSSS